MHRHTSLRQTINNMTLSVHSTVLKFQKHQSPKDVTNGLFSLKAWNYIAD